ncbi:MAG: Hsp33 family molecular chaperone [Hyphomicrobiaceae bacterium]|nr:Hsp33 family molecular chaperone [Hyphomicrobiaceae bacterium]
MEAAQSRPPADASLADDLVLPFQADRAGVSGRLVRLGPAVDRILRGHDYPDSVCTLLGEAVALTAMLGASLKFDGKFTFQTKTDGPVNMLVVDYRSSGTLRGYAGFDAQAVAALEAEGDIAPGDLLGQGHLAMTIDRGPDMDNYQGVVSLEGSNLNEAADAYFRQSEQLPTFIRVAVARLYSADASAGGEDQDHWSWRAGGLMVQHLTREGGHGVPEKVPDEDGWNRALILAQTVQDQELVDPLLAPERLIYRLFHEEHVRAFETRRLAFECGCSPDRVKSMLNSFSAAELADMAEEGRIRVTCQFCNAQYDFNPADFAQMSGESK